MEKAVIFDISHYMIEDGPGIRTNVFMKGCPLRCKWCSNVCGLKKEIQMTLRIEKCIGCGKCLPVCPAGAISMSENGTYVEQDFGRCINCMKCVSVCPAGARNSVGKEYTVDEALREVEKDRIFYRRGRGGVTVSGGEALMQAEFAAEFLKACKNAYLSTAVETSGCGKWTDLRKMIQYCDVLFMDCKHMNEKKHRELTGVGNTFILENIRRAALECRQTNKVMVVRMPLIPGLNDDKENLLATARFVRKLELELNILPYHNYGAGKYEWVGMEYPLKRLKPPSLEQIKAVSELLREERIHFTVGGYNVESY